MFLVSATAEEFFSFSYGLVFCVKDRDIVKDRIVGRAELTQEQLLYMDGDRVGITLDIPAAILNHPANRAKLQDNCMYNPKLYLRVRKATMDDKKFIRTFNEIQKFKRQGVYTDTTFQSNRNWINAIKRNSKQKDDVEKVSLYFVSCFFFREMRYEKKR